MHIDWRWDWYHTTHLCHGAKVSGPFLNFKEAYIVVFVSSFFLFVTRDQARAEIILGITLHVYLLPLLHLTFWLVLLSGRFSLSGKLHQGSEANQKVTRSNKYRVLGVYCGRLWLVISLKLSVAHSSSAAQK